jgi:AICAR transformylase/IMP cyclohydrolase PurH
MTNGIEIHLSQLNSITIAKDGKTVTIGGGVISKNVTDTLWAAGKQTGENMTNSLQAAVAIKWSKNLNN